MAIKPFRIDVPDAELADLQVRLARTRWPEDETVADWSQGVPLAYLKDLCRYWADDYDWRRLERELNELGQWRADVGNMGIHFLHVRSPHRGSLPLLLTHGWPGSVVEFLQVIGPLTDPPAFGGDAADSFDVVCPSLPGYGFSDKPSRSGCGVRQIADLWNALMADLGYERYGAQGGDWGAQVTTALAVDHPESVIGIHLNMVLAFPDPGSPSDPTAEERDALESFDRYRRFDAGYAKVQSTRPQTIGYGLVDSPAALCAWIIEKFWSWTDCQNEPLEVLSRDQLLDNVMLYWIPKAGASSARLYWEAVREAPLGPVRVPVGCSIFPGEIVRPSRQWAEGRFQDLRYWNRTERGGHFAAFEQPDIFVSEVRTAFRTMR